MPAIAELPAGASQHGLQAAIEVASTSYRLGRSFEMTLVLTNVSDEAINIDTRPATWSVLLYDERGRRLVPLWKRPERLPAVWEEKILTLHPTDQWRLAVKGRLLNEGEPGTEPYWRYAPLTPGVYWVGASYRSEANPGYFLLWSGEIDSQPARMTVVAAAE